MTRWIKICGITREADAERAVEHGANALGFVFWPQSPRYVTPDRAANIRRRLPPELLTVGVFVNQSIDDVTRVAREAGVSTIQLHGDETPAYAAELGNAIWRALSVGHGDEELASWPTDVTILLDTCDPVRRGGTGMTIDWDEAAIVARQRRVVLAGGLTPDNVEEAIERVRPAGVDVSSGVEQSPGVKDVSKMMRFIERARAGFNDH